MEPDVVRGPLRAAFLGRIVEHKGLHIALEALAMVTAPVVFDVYGSREDEHYASQCEDIAARLPANITAIFHGAIAPDDVGNALRAHDALLAPTAGENFGHVIAEALAASCVVVVTPETPWTELLLKGGGRVVDRTVLAWASGIQELAEASFEERLALRLAAGRRYEEWLRRPRPPHVWALALLGTL